MNTVHRVLTPTDFSDRSRRAIQLAADEPRLRNAELHLLHCVVTGMVGHPMDGPAIIAPAELVGDAERSLTKFPEGDEPTDSGRLVLNVVRIVLQGHPETLIIDYAKEHCVDIQ